MNYWIPHDKIKKLKIVNERLTAKEVYNKYKPDYFINLALYDTLSGQNIMAMEDENKKDGYVSSTKGMGIRGDKELVWVTPAEAFADPAIRDFVGFRPSLVDEGSINIDWGNIKASKSMLGKHIRSVIGWNDNYLILCATDNSVTIESAADIAKSALHCKYAGNCDGGGSSHLQKGSEIAKKSIRRNASWLLVYVDRLQDFIDGVTENIGYGYVYGTQGEIPTARYIEKLAKVFGKQHYYFNGYSAEKWIGIKSFDCSGLFVYELRRRGYIDKNADYTAFGLYTELCEKIRSSDLRNGDLVFRGNPISHVGMYLDGKVFHAKGTKYGVVITDELNTFTRFGRLKCLI